MAPSLRQRLNEDRLVSAPGVFDMISLKLADSMGFELLYMTGYGTVASLLGLPDAGLATYTDMIGRVAAMARMAKTPLIADGDTGYGGLLNVRHTVRGYEAAGAAGIQLEDQEFPKKCGHTRGAASSRQRTWRARSKSRSRAGGPTIFSLLHEPTPVLRSAWTRRCVVPSCTQRLARTFSS
jgi:2-methylisocitrate lyase-like PEP mutase family enzyme